MNWMELLRQSLVLNGDLAMIEHALSIDSCFWQYRHGYFILDSASSVNGS